MCILVLKVAICNLNNVKGGQTVLKKQQGLRKLKGLLTERGITYKELATEIGIETATMSNKINGKAYFNLKEVEDICNSLDISALDVGRYFFTNNIA